jgi:preprotein translocase subunit SecG
VGRPDFIGQAVTLNDTPHTVIALRGIDADLGISREVTMRSRIGDSSSAYLRRSSAWLIGGFAGLALLLGVVGADRVRAEQVARRQRGP